MAVIMIPSMIIVAIVAAIIMPVVTIPVIVAIADYFLVMPTPVICIFSPDISIVPPWAWLIYNHFVPMINIIISILGR